MNKVSIGCPAATFTRPSFSAPSRFGSNDYVEFLLCSHAVNAAAHVPTLNILTGASEALCRVNCPEGEVEEGLLSFWSSDPRLRNNLPSLASVFNKLGCVYFPTWTTVMGCSFGSDCFGVTDESRPFFFKKIFNNQNNDDDNNNQQNDEWNVEFL